MGAFALMLIGLTGKSCSGKNYVGSLIKRRGFEVWDLDAEASKIRRKNSNKVMEAFGTTNASEIRDIVFSDPSKLRELESIIYPELTEKILAFKEDLVINGATLYRCGLDKYCRAVIYIDAPYKERLERAMLRDHISSTDFDKRDKSQSDVDYREVEYRCPVYCIVNSQDRDLTLDLDNVLSALTGF